MSESERINLALSYATLLLIDGKCSVNADNLKKVLETSKIVLDPSFVKVFASSVGKIGGD